MVAHLTTLNLCPDKMDEVITIYKEGIIPLLHQLQGCRLITLLTDPPSNQIIAIGWWENESDLATGQMDSRYQQQLSQVAPNLTAIPRGTSYQVSIQVAPI